MTFIASFVKILLGRLLYWCRKSARVCIKRQVGIVRYLIGRHTYQVEVVSWQLADLTAPITTVLSYQFQLGHNSPFLGFFASVQISIILIRPQLVELSVSRPSSTTLTHNPSPIQPPKWVEDRK